VRSGKQLPLYARALEAGAPLAVVLPAAPAAGLQVKLRAEDMTWQEFLGPSSSSSNRGSGRGYEQQQQQGLEPYMADAYEVTNILFSSGTTVRGFG
jgi:hypothetical protein